MKSKAYRGTAVNRIDGSRLGAGREGQAVTVGVDVGKYQLAVVARWADGAFERPWSVANPEQVPVLVALLGELGRRHRLTVALEPSGTYGDALRQALGDAGIAVRRVSPKAAHDYAEVFDGVPSQHDHKGAAVVAELAALGKAWPWPYVARSEWEQELASCVDWLAAQRRIALLWLGRLEALLARHWPELTRQLPVSSGALLRMVAHYGSPAALAADGDAGARLRCWGRQRLSAARVAQVVASAGTTAGVRLGEVERGMLRRYAEQALVARREVRRSQRRLRALAAEQPVLQAQGRAVGVPTACVLWVAVGDPRQYGSGAAYRKAMGLNLVEHSSGTYQGQLRISKRGSPRVRQWLYMAALRLIRREGVAGWYRARKGRGPVAARKALVGVMRKLALALYRVAVSGVAFEARRLFPRPRGRQRAQGVQGVVAELSRSARARTEQPKDHPETL
jgi:transposase